MQAIKTEYFGPGNVKGSRIKATSASGISITVSYDHALDTDENHQAACKALMEKLKWGGTMAGGALDNNKWAWVFTNGSHLAHGPDGA